MASINFQNGTIIPASWLNDVNNAVYGQVIPMTTPTTVANLISPTNLTGTRAFVSDATATTFGTVVVGGGSNPVPVYSNGTNWIIG
jgi:hypothetical protein